ncbi:MAG: HD domain-containing protein [Desulfovibrionaceae bacterium]|nr:HD domain-containing protein [Desulfovibrionaceae bacterium]
MAPLHAAYSRKEAGMALLSGVDCLPHPYALFDHKGRLKYGNPPFHHMFGDVARDADVFTLLRDTLGIDDFSHTYSDEGIESLCIGFLQQDGGPPKTFRVLGARVAIGEDELFQCIISQIRPQVALQIGIRDIEVQDKVRLAQFVGSIAVEMDPQETGQHLLRTSRRLGRLCRAMKASGEYELSEMDIEAACACCILHDVGKMSLPGGILHKPSRLTELEWSIIKNHVVLGLTLAETLKLPKMAADIIAYHHCRWDGVQDRWDPEHQMRDPERGGYPFSAKGEDIPLWARAFAYVDIFDALVTPRSYKPAWNIWEAAGYIRDNLAGTHLDPGICPSFLQSLDGVAC